MLQGLVSKDIQTSLPTIPWLSCYGPPYLELIGRDRLASAPFWKVEEIDSRQLLCQSVQDSSECLDREYNSKREVIKAAIECWVVQLLAEVLEATLNLVFLPFTALELDIAKGINVVDCIVPCKSGKVVAPFLPDGVSVDPLPDVRIVEGRSGAAGGDQDGQRHPLGGLSN